MSGEIRVIERTDEEYMNDLKEFYITELKPLLNSGMSLTKAFHTLKISNSRGARKYKELRRMALEDGYKLRR